MEGKRRILVVEDSKTQAMKLEYLLYRNQFEPLIAENGEAALKLSLEHEPDLIISDIVMPEMSGYEFCLLVRSTEKIKNIPVILLTALSETKDIIKGLECGASNFITKPYRDEYIIKQIHTLLANNELRSQQDLEKGIPLRFNNEDFYITSDRSQILDILITTYETAITKNLSLRKAEADLKNLNMQLEHMVIEKTAHLTREIEQRKKAQIEISRLSNVVHQAKSVIVITDLDGNIEYANPKFTDVTGYTLEEVIGKNPRFLKSGKHDDAFYREIWEKVLAGKEWRGEFINKKKNGELFYEVASIFDIRDDDGIVRNLAKISEDVTQRKLDEERLENYFNSILADIELASSVQSYLLPEWLVHENNLSVTSVYTPSEKVGGDIFDVIHLTDSKYVVYVGDISGHGIQAALIMTAVKSTINMLVNIQKEDIQPHAIINKLNEILSKDFFQSNYMTIIFCLVDLKENTIKYLNAGHPAIIEYNKISGKTQILDIESSIPVGWMGNYQYEVSEQVEVELSEDSVYFLYTDGLFECLNVEGSELGVKGFTSFLSEYSKEMNKIILPFMLKQKLIDEKYDLTGDDFTLLTLQKYEDSGENDRLLLRYSNKTRKKVNEKYSAFVIDNFSDESYLTVINSIIASHVSEICSVREQKDVNNAILIQLIVRDGIEITFWETCTAKSSKELKEKNYIVDCNFKKYDLQRNFYDDIIETCVHVPF